MPPGRGEGKEDRYVYTDSNGNPAELQVCFQWNPASQVQGAGNVMVIRGLTPDLARYLDQLVDGKPDAQEGRFLASSMDQSLVDVRGADCAVGDEATLFGYSRGVDLATCGALGSLAAAEVISHIGARPQADLAALAAPILGS